MLVTGTPGAGNPLTASFPLGVGAGKWQSGVADVWTDIAGETNLTYLQTGAVAGKKVRFLATSYAPFGAAINVPPLASYLGPVATGVNWPNAQATSFKQIMSETFHVWTETGSATYIGYENSRSTDFTVTSPSTYAVSIEYPVGSNIFYEGKFGGQHTGICPDMSKIISDGIAINYTKGTAFKVRTYHTNPSGIVYCAGTPSNGSINGERSTYGASGVVDQTLGGAIVDTSPGVAIRPVAILGSTSAATVYIAGDSRGAGAFDTYSAGTPDIGELCRSVGVSLGYINVSISGTTASGLLSSGVRRHDWLQFCSNRYFGFPVNDLGGGITAAAALAILRQLWAQDAAKPAVQSTCTPFTTTSDSGATLGGQTATARSSVIVSLNALLLAEPMGNGLAAVANTAAAVTSLTDSQKWVPLKSTDCQHAIQAGCLDIKNSGATTPAMFVR